MEQKQSLGDYCREFQRYAINSSSDFFAFVVVTNSHNVSLRQVIGEGRHIASFSSGLVCEILDIICDVLYMDECECQNLLGICGYPLAPDQSYVPWLL